MKLTETTGTKWGGQKPKGRKNSTLNPEKRRPQTQCLKKLWKGRNSAQRKKQTRNTEIQINEEEISKLLEKEFRIMIVKMIRSVDLLSHVRLFVTPWTIAHQTSLSFSNPQSSPKPMSIESVMLFNHLILCHPLLLLPSIVPSIRVFSNKSALHIRWPKYWSFSFNISPTNEHPGLISFRMDWLDLLAV